MDHYCTSCHAEKRADQMMPTGGCISCHEKRVLTGKISLLALKFSGSIADVRPVRSNPRVEKIVRKVLA